MHFNQCCSTHKQVSGGGRVCQELRRVCLRGLDDQRRFPPDAHRQIAKRNEELYENDNQTVR